MRQMYSLRPRCVADGLKTISAPLRPSAAPALGEVPVVADVHADLADRGVEDRVPAVAGTEVELLPEALRLRDVLLAELAEVRAVGVDHGGGVVVHPGLLVLVHRQHHHHAELLGDAAEPLRRRAVGDQLGVAVVLGVLHLAEVRARRRALGSRSPAHPRPWRRARPARVSRSSPPSSLPSRFGEALLARCSACRDRNVTPMAAQ